MSRSNRATQKENEMKRKTLVDAWAQLDIKEEAELRSTNKIFEDLKNHFDSGIHTQEDVKFELAITQQLEKLQKEEAKGGALSVTTRTSELKRNRTTLSEISASNPGLVSLSLFEVVHLTVFSYVGLGDGYDRSVQGRQDSPRIQCNEKSDIIADVVELTYHDETPRGSL
jgi:hypothetical protein